MRRHLQAELEKLKKRILSLGAMAEERVRMAITAIENRDGNLALKIIEADREIDEAEVEVEEECLKVLALHQPVAVDLRFISAVIKINNDLERIGDEAVNIAERVANIARRRPLSVPIHYTLMAEKAETMLKKSLDALVNLDVDLAYRVCLMDDDVDQMNRDFYDKVKDAIRDQPDQVGYLINFLFISRHLERIADHATNIAEEVIYMIEGVIPRHRKAELGVVG
jgi:phosphate transport system protein